MILLITITAESRNVRRCCISDLSPGAPVCNYVGRGRQCSVTHQGPRSMVRHSPAPGAVPVSVWMFRLLALVDSASEI